MRFLVAVPRDFSGNPVPEMLSKYGVCDVSSDPKEIMFLCNCNEYDALVLAASLESGDCDSLCKELREQDEDLTVIRLSAKPSCEEKVRLLGSGADIYLPADVGSEEFYAELSVLLRRNNRTKIRGTIKFKGFSFCMFKRALFYGKEPKSTQKD